jgi:hypothetical protein
MPLLAAITLHELAMPLLSTNFAIVFICNYFSTALLYSLSLFCFRNCVISLGDFGLVGTVELVLGLQTRLVDY